MGFDECTLVYCRSSKKTSEKIRDHLTELCKKEYLRLEDLASRKERLRPHLRRQLEYVKDVQAFGVNCISNNVPKPFKDGEVLPNLEQSVRGHDVYVIQNTLSPNEPQMTHTNIWEMILTIDGVLRSGARRVSAVIPYLSYSKQERRTGRQPISAAAFIQVLQGLGVKQLVTMDLHSSAVEGAAHPRDMIIENLYASSILIDYFSPSMGPDDIWAAPDPGAAKQVQRYSKITGKEMVIAYKYRSITEAHTVEEQRLLGDVQGKHLKIIDDQIATGTTMGKLAEKATAYGAKSCEVGITHGPLFEEAEDKLQQLYSEGKVQKIVRTDTLNLSDEFLERNQFIEEITVMPFFASAIYELHTMGSLKKLYNPLLQKELFGLKND